MLFDKLKADRLAAMKIKDSRKNALLSTLVGEIENKNKNKNKIKVSKETIEIIDEIVIATAKKFIKSIEQTIELLHEANANTDNEMGELKILSEYMPQSLLEEETTSIVTDAIKNLDIQSMKEMGKLMGFMKKNYGARVDMSFVSKLIKEKVS